MRRIAFLLVLAAASPALGADFGPSITTTDGKSYTRGADGHYYPADSAPVAANCATGSCSVSVTVQQGRPTPIRDALAQLNAQRAARRLHAYQHDPALAEAALKAAQYRADRCIEGHTANDFAFLPPGCSASAAGCAAWPAHLGFGACAAYEGWTFAGAASVTGRDGRVYHHLFVR